MFECDLFPVRPPISAVKKTANSTAETRQGTAKKAQRFR